MDVKHIDRVFNYNGVSLPDLPGKTVEDVKGYYSNLYPELNNAIVPEPVYSGDKVIYTFGRNTGVKG